MFLLIANEEDATFGDLIQLERPPDPPDTNNPTQAQIMLSLSRHLAPETLRLLVLLVIFSPHPSFVL